MAEKTDYDLFGELEKVSLAERKEAIAGIQREGEGTSDLGRVVLEALLAVQNSTSADSQSEAELSPHRQLMLDLLLLGERYEQGIQLGFYTAESAPKHKVEEWLRAEPTLLDWAIASEKRGGRPMFTGDGDEDGTWQMDECSEEAPKDMISICWGPESAEFRFGVEGRELNALNQAIKLGHGSRVITKERGEKLDRAGLIKNKNSWEWRAHPDNRDLVMDGKRVKDCGLAWNVGRGRIGPDNATDLYGNGGLRCSRSAPKPA